MKNMEFTPRKEPVIYVVEPYGGSVRKHLPSLPLVYWDDAAVTRETESLSLCLSAMARPRTSRAMANVLLTRRWLSSCEPQLEKWEEATNLAIADYFGPDGQGEAKRTWTLYRARLDRTPHRVGSGAAHRRQDY